MKSEIPFLFSTSKQIIIDLKREFYCKNPFSNSFIKYKNYVYIFLWLYFNKILQFKYAIQAPVSILLGFLNYLLKIWFIKIFIYKNVKSISYFLVFLFQKALNLLRTLFFIFTCWYRELCFLARKKIRLLELLWFYFQLFLWRKCAILRFEKKWNRPSSSCKIRNK